LFEVITTIGRSAARTVSWVS